jgi:DNA-binding NarL/FixJ family response regulator
MKSLRIIIADTSEHFRKALRRILMNISDNLNIAEASNGNQLIDLALTADPQIIFTEVRMQDNDGIFAVRKIRQRGCDARIYAFSAYENADYVALMREAGADGFLVKKNDNYDMLREILASEIKDTESSNPESGIHISNYKSALKKRIINIKQDSPIL